MDKENKVSQPYSLEPVIVAWATRKAAEQTLRTGEKVSASSIVNDALKKAMLEDEEQGDVEHLRKFIQKQILKQRS